jgi:hypothetical protein
MTMKKNYELCFVEFLDYLDTSNTVDANVVEVSIDNCYPIIVNSETLEELKESNVEDSWTTMPINSIKLERGHYRLTIDIYEPSPVWERPVGHAMKGIDAFKIQCHVNSLKEPVTIVIGNSGAAPTLISQKFLDGLKTSKP